MIICAKSKKGNYSVKASHSNTSVWYITLVADTDREERERNGEKDRQMNGQREREGNEQADGHQNPYIPPLFWEQGYKKRVHYVSDISTRWLASENKLGMKEYIFNKVMIEFL